MQDPDSKANIEVEVEVEDPALDGIRPLDGIRHLFVEDPAFLGRDGIRSPCGEVNGKLRCFYPMSVSRCRFGQLLRCFYRMADFGKLTQSSRCPASFRKIVNG